MGTVLTQRDHDRFMAWQAGLLAVVLLMSLGAVSRRRFLGLGRLQPDGRPALMAAATAQTGATGWWKTVSR